MDAGFKWINKGTIDFDKISKSVRFTFYTESEQGIHIEKIEEGTGVFKINFDYKSFPFDKQSIDIGIYHYNDIALESHGAQFIDVRNIAPNSDSYFSGKLINMKDSFKSFEATLAGWKVVNR